MCMEWKDGTKTWVLLKEIKESYPVQVAEYAVANKLMSEPTFAWWTPFTLKKREQIISAVKARLKKKTHKYGVLVPNTVKEAYMLDKEAGNALWQYSVSKEMKNNRVSFQVLDNDQAILPGYTSLECHMIFEVKMELTREARFVNNGVKTPDPKESIYDGVVSRESVRITFTYAALMGFGVMAADIQNAYLKAPTNEKYWTTCGPEFGTEESDKRAIIVRDLYGMKSSGRGLRNHL